MLPAGTVRSPRKRLRANNADKIIIRASSVVRGCNYHIRALRQIRPLRDLDTAKMLAQGIVDARLNYCNSLMCCGMSNKKFQAASGNSKCSRQSSVYLVSLARLIQRCRNILHHLSFR